MNKMSGVRLACHSFFLFVPSIKNNKQTEALSYVCSLFLKNVTAKSVF